MQCILTVSDFSQKSLPWRLLKVNALNFELCDPENLKLGTLHNFFWGGWMGRGGGFRGVIQTQLFLPSISIYEFLHVYL